MNNHRERSGQDRRRCHRIRINVRLMEAQAEEDSPIVRKRGNKMSIVTQAHRLRMLDRAIKIYRSELKFFENLKFQNRNISSNVHTC